MTKLFVGNLPYTTTNDQLTEMFQAIGAVTEAIIVADKFSGRSKGFGFVTMDNDEEAQTAIAQLNGTAMDGRNIIVSVARPKEDRPPRDNNRGGGGFNRGGRDDNRRGY